MSSSPEMNVSPTIKQLRLTREEEVRTEDGFSLWVQRYAVTVTRTINPLSMPR